MFVKLPLSAVKQFATARLPIEDRRLIAE